MFINAALRGVFNLPAQRALRKLHVPLYPLIQREGDPAQNDGQAKKECYSGKARQKRIGSEHDQPPKRVMDQKQGKGDGAEKG